MLYSLLCNWAVYTCFRRIQFNLPEFHPHNGTIKQTNANAQNAQEKKLSHSALIFKDKPEILAYLLGV